MMFFRVVVVLLFTFSFLMVGNPVGADTVTVDLEYRTDTLVWELYAEINDTGGGSSGDSGLAALRALIDNVDFGTNGEAVNISTALGAIDPIDEGGPNERPAVLQTTRGTLDIIYGQDISDAASVVGGIGVGSRELIMDGTFPLAGTPPAFGDDEGGFTTDGNFLDVVAPGPFGDALPWDNAVLNVLDVTPGVAGDYNGNGIVDAADYTAWLAALGGTTLPNDPTLGTVDISDYEFWKTKLGATSGSGTSTSIPEPNSLLLVTLALAGLLTRRSEKL